MINKIIVFIYLLLNLLSYRSVALENNLETSQALLVFDKEKNPWWGKFVSINNDVVLIKFPKQARTVPRNQVVPCFAPNKKKHILVLKSGTREVVKYICENDYLRITNGDYLKPGQYVIEVNVHSDIKKAVKILDKSGGFYKVKSVFADGSIYATTPHTRIATHVSQVIKVGEGGKKEIRQGAIFNSKTNEIYR